MRTLGKIAVSVLVLLVLAILFLWHSVTWSERLLRPVRRGMSQNQVRALVGSPLRVVTRTNATDAWYYDHWWSSDAVVYFDTNQMVSAVETD
jgi:outer membrane protein assembly factor BamE (lipoprotein component of BamABCDE complex)